MPTETEIAAQLKAADAAKAEAAYTEKARVIAAARATLAECEKREAATSAELQRAAAVYEAAYEAQIAAEKDYADYDVKRGNMGRPRAADFDPLVLIEKDVERYRRGLLRRLANDPYLEARQTHAGAASKLDLARRSLAAIE